MKSEKFWNLQNTNSIKQLLTNKDEVMSEIFTPSLVSVILDRISYAYDQDVGDSIIRDSIIESEPAYFWTSRRRLLLELMIAEFPYTAEAGRDNRFIPFP
jgi:hypothetical protein